MRPSGSRLAKLSILAVALAGCGEATAPSLDDVVAHRAAWSAHNLSDYSYTYETTGFFINYADKPIRITVRNGVVVSAVFVATGKPASESPTDLPTIDRLFEQAEGAARDHSLLSISFDLGLSYPRRMDLDGPPDASGALIASQLERAP